MRITVKQSRWRAAWAMAALWCVFTLQGSVGAIAAGPVVAAKGLAAGWTSASGKTTQSCHCGICHGMAHMKMCCCKTAPTPAAAIIMKSACAPDAPAIVSAEAEWPVTVPACHVVSPRRHSSASYVTLHAAVPSRPQSPEIQPPKTTS